MKTIQELNKDSFESVVKENKIVIIDFWAPWCGPCRNFAPIFEKASLDLKNSDIIFCKVNTDTETNLSVDMNIKSIPTIMIFVNGKLSITKSGALLPSHLDTLLQDARQYLK